MVTREKSKAKLLYLLEFLRENSDENHHISVQDIIDYLADNDIKAERKTVYNDIQTLMDYGFDIITEKGERNRNMYYLIPGEFEITELQLLTDIIQSSKFISNRKSAELVNKLKTFTSRYNSSLLNRQIYFPEGTKNSNETIYYTLNDLNIAISKKIQVEFRYGEWTLEKKLKPRNNGKYYRVSPYNLIWDNQFYYLIAFDNEDEKIKHFRVDRILHKSKEDFRIIDEPQMGAQEYDKLKLPIYTSSHFGMYSGEIVNVRFLCDNSMIGVFLDRFGENIILGKVDDTHFSTSANVSLSQQFFGWVAALGDKVKITDPPSAVEFFRKETERLKEQYS